MIALLLAIMWVPVSSHDFLSLVGWVHDHHEEEHAQGTNHDFAHGCCLAHEAAMALKSPPIVSWGLLAAPSVRTLILALVVSLRAPFLSRIPDFEPGWDRSWHFRLRMALPSRAP